MFIFHIETRLQPILREITDNRASTKDELEALYRKIVSSVLLRSGLGSPTGKIFFKHDLKRVLKYRGRHLDPPDRNRQFHGNVTDHDRHCQGIIKSMSKDYYRLPGGRDLNPPTDHDRHRIQNKVFFM